MLGTLAAITHNLWTGKDAETLVAADFIPKLESDTGPDPESVYKKVKGWALSFKDNR